MKFSFLFLLLILTFGGITAYAVDTASVVVTETTEFSFSPSATGYWTFHTSGSDHFDNRPFLHIGNEFGHTLASGDFITVHMVEGAEYVVYAGFWQGEAGRFMLNIFHSHTFEGFIAEYTMQVTDLVIPGRGGRVEGYGEVAISFTPDTSGLWSFQVFSDEEPFPMWLEDPFHNLVAFDNFLTFSGYYSDNHSAFTVQLVAGVEYMIYTMMPMWIPVEFAVSVELLRDPEDFVPWLDQDYLYLEGFALDLEADRVEIPSGGAEMAVDGATWFSFTPNESGPWTFYTFGNTGDPLIVLTDSLGSFFLGDDDGGDGLNSRLTTYLAADVEYVLWARFWQPDGTGSYTLRVLPHEEVQQEAAEELQWEVIPLPGTGGEFPVDDFYGVFSFTPNVTGTWALWLDAGFSYLAISDYNQTFRVESETWQLDQQPLITMDLAAGVEYEIMVWWDWVPTSLNITPANHIRGNSDFVQRQVARDTDFTFVPEESSYWVIYTSNAIAGDPFLQILGSTGVIAEDDDSGEGLNAMIKLPLESNVEYIIRAGFFRGSIGNYVINIRRIASETPRPRLMPPAVSERVIIPEEIVAEELDTEEIVAEEHLAEESEELDVEEDE